MTGLIKKAVGTVLGVAVMLGYWTFVGDSGKQTESMSNIPAKVWDGGAGTMQIEIDSTGRSDARQFLRGGTKMRSQWKPTKTLQQLPHPGLSISHEYGGYVELGAVKPKVGDKLTMKVLVNGKVAYEENSTLETELQPNYAFFVQAHFEDYSRAEQGDE
jgi:hypothetical protein